MEYLSKIKYAFFGSPEFAVNILENLIKLSLIPSLVITNPDRPIGRKKIVTPPPIKQLIDNQNPNTRKKIKLFQPETIKEAKKELSIPLADMDVAIVAAYAKIIPQELINYPRAGTIGVHPSLLPKYRGASPIQSAILDGETKTGVTLYLLDDKIDHGPIINSQTTEINPEETYLELQKKLSLIGAKLLIENLIDFLNKKITPKPQDESRATHTQKINTEDAFIKYKDIELATSGKNSEAAYLIDRKIKALNPEPGPWTIVKNSRVKLLESKIVEGKLILKKIQKSGKKPTNSLDVF